MTALTITLAVAAYITCFIYSAGAAFAYLQREYPIIAKRDRRKDCVTSIVFAFFGPFTAPVLTFVTGFLQHGWKFPTLKDPVPKG